MVSVPPVSANVPVLHAAPSPPAPPTGQKMVVQPVKKVSGVQYLRQPNGQLFQLVPLSQLTQVQLKPPHPRGEAPPLLVKTNMIEVAKIQEVVYFKPITCFCWVLPSQAPPQPAFLLQHIRLLSSLLSANHLQFPQ